jgi:epoxyqueuosine reductase
LNDILKKLLLGQSQEIGFSMMRICSPSDIPNAASKLNSFIEKNHHGSMSWMAERIEWRGNPAALWPEAKSIIMLADNYSPEHDPMEILNYSDHGAISVYAQNQDYHELVKKKLKRLGRWLIKQENDAQIKVFVDTAPVMEKPLGAAAGLGWQGKHTNLVSRDLGSWFFLGAIFTTLDLPKDTAENDHCGTCTACLDICPTSAFPSPYELDARKCISYLTIEHSGPVDLNLREKLGNRIYGCDDCLAVCPWNKFAQEANEIGYHARTELKAPKLEKLVDLDDKNFRLLFSKSPIKRIGRDRFVRNVLYAIGNSGNKELINNAKKLQSDLNPVVQDAANWAVSKLKGHLND